MISCMVGRDVKTILNAPPAAPLDSEFLNVRGLSQTGIVRDIDLTVTAVKSLASSD